MDIRHDLHWLPVSHCFIYKLCLITWKTLHTAYSPYLSELITHYLPSGILLSSNANLLAIFSMKSCDGQMEQPAAECD